MFEIAFALGIFAYLVFLIGIAGFAYPVIFIILGIFYWATFFIWKRKELVKGFGSIRVEKSIIFRLSLFYIALQGLVNFVGLLGPEIGFDAIWYHLTLPKLYLLYHTVMHIPGNILYYSDMPRLTEMLYMFGLSLGSDFWARGIHFLFGILTMVAIYKIGRKYVSAQWAILLPVIFYSNLVVGWESISGYIDLSRTFFSVMSLFAFLIWHETKKRNWLVVSALLVGLTVSTKLLALGDIALYALALLFIQKESVKFLQRLSRAGMFILVALLGALPWFVFSFIHTGNPVYPLFSTLHMPSTGAHVLNPLFFLTTLWTTFSRASDPINPLFLAIIPFLIITWKKIKQQYALILYLTVGSFVLWYITPQTGGGRYILPYLPLFSLTSLLVIQQLSKQWQRIFIIFIFLVALLSLFYRSLANAKFVPLLLHRETKAHFMTKHLQFNLGDFYDIDGYFAKYIKPTDKVLLYGFHNLYYVDFPYIDSSWVQKGDRFTYIAVQGKGMPIRFQYWNLVYFNITTQVRLYSFKGQLWVY